MEKPFLEVFPGLHIGDELKELLKLVMVEKIAMPKDRSSLRIYIVSPRLIHKKNIYSMRNEEQYKHLGNGMCQRSQGRKEFKETEYD